VSESVYTNASPSYSISCIVPWLHTFFVVGIYWLLLLLLDYTTAGNLFHIHVIIYVAYIILLKTCTVCMYIYVDMCNKNHVCKIKKSFPITIATVAAAADMIQGHKKYLCM
jgi:apolipoprotein N-acyltransferase